MKKIKEINEYGQNISVKNANLWYGDFRTKRGGLIEKILLERKKGKQNKSTRLNKEDTKLNKVIGKRPRF